MREKDRKREREKERERERRRYEWMIGLLIFILYGLAQGQIEAKY